MQDPFYKTRRPANMMGFEFGLTNHDSHVTEGVQARRNYEASLPVSADAPVAWFLINL